MKKAIIISTVLFAFSFLDAQIRVTTDGKTGIGITNPYKKLHVVGNSVFTSNTGGIESAGFIRGNNIYSSVTTPDFTWYNNDQTGLFHPNAGIIGFSINGNERFSISSTTFNVKGIFRLDHFTDVIIDYENGTCCGQPSMYPENNWYLNLGTPTKKLGDVFATHVLCNLLTEGSDKKLKENISPIDNPLKKIMRINGVRYNLKTDMFEGLPEEIIQELVSKKQIGFIAQDIEQVYPALVETNKKTGLKSVSYTRMIPILLEAIKEQQIQIEDLRNTINDCCKVEGGNKSSNTNSTNIEDEIVTNINTRLFQNIPNPFSEQTTIKYEIDKKSSNATILILNMQGTLINTYNNLNVGKGQITINSGELKAGMYMYSLIADGKEIDTKKMTLTD